MWVYHLYRSQRSLLPRNKFNAQRAGYYSRKHFKLERRVRATIRMRVTVNNVTERERDAVSIHDTEGVRERTAREWEEK